MGNILILKSGSTFHDVPLWYIMKSYNLQFIFYVFFRQLVIVNYQ